MVDHSASEVRGRQERSVGEDFQERRTPMAKKMGRTLAELEREFANETSLERHRRAWLHRTATTRQLKRETDRRHRRGSVRFALLVMTLVGTAVTVSAAMFATLYLLLD